MEEDTCEYCGRIFATSKGLSNHLRGDSPCRRGVVGDGCCDDGGRWSCDNCGRCFESYMGRTQHYNASSQCAPWNRRGALTSPAGRMTHTPRSAPVDDDFTMDDDDDGPLDVESNTSSSDTDGEDLTRYVEALCEAGTYDANFVSCHLNRARHEGMTEQVLESCKFLRATETGEGCSRRQVEALLAHAHSLGGRGDLLPKGYKKLWDCVEKVCLWCPSVCMVMVGVCVLCVCGCVWRMCGATTPSFPMRRRACYMWCCTNCFIGISLRRQMLVSHARVLPALDDAIKCLQTTHNTRHCYSMYVLPNLMLHLKN